MTAYTRKEINEARRINSKMVMSTVHMAEVSGVSVEIMNKFAIGAFQKLEREGLSGDEVIYHEALYKDDPMNDAVYRALLVEWKLYVTIMKVVTKAIGEKLREEWSTFHEDVFGAPETKETALVEVEVVEDEICITSLQIVEETGKDHKNVLRDIRTMLEELELGELRFESTYRNSQNKELPMFILPKREAMILASGYSIKLRAGIVDKLDKLEKEAKVAQPQLPNFNDPVEMARAWADSEEGKQKAIGVIKHKDGVIDRKNEQIKVASAMSIEVGESTVSEFVKTLGIKDFGLKACFEWLREHEYIMKNGEPYQYWINKGYFKHKPWKEDKGEKAHYQPILEARGRLALGGKIREELEGDVA